MSTGPESSPPPPAPQNEGFGGKVRRLATENGLSQTSFMALMVGLGGVLLFAISVLLPWVSLPGHSFLGISFGWGVFLLLLALAAGAFVAVAFFSKANLPLSLAVAATFGTFAFFDVLSTWAAVGSFAGFGLIIAFLMSIGMTAGFVYCSLQHPFKIGAFQKETTSPLLRDHGALLAGQAVAVLIGLILLIVRLASSSSYRG